MENTRKLDRLIAETEELLSEISDQKGSPEFDVLRHRLERSLTRTKAVLSGQQGNQLKVRHVAASVNEYVRDYPWMALATGVLVASTIGILANNATRRSYDQGGDQQHA